VEHDPHFLFPELELPMPEEEEKRESLDLFCPRCNRHVEAKIGSSAYGTITEEIAALISDDIEIGGASIQYQIAFCGRCAGPFLRRLVKCESADFAVQHYEQILFPVIRQFDLTGVPNSIGRSYEQAARSFSAGLYEPCAIMCGKCLEALCREMKATGHNLKDKLSTLLKQGTIDEKLFDWADQLRIVRNDAAHDLSTHLDVDDARDAIEFVEAILMYTFTLDRKFEAFTKRRQSKSASP
jgi:hypothetical protein